MPPPIQMVSEALRDAKARAAENLLYHERKLIDAHQGVNVAIGRYNEAVASYNASTELAVALAERLHSVVSGSIERRVKQGADPGEIEHAIEYLMRFTGTLAPLKPMQPTIDDPLGDFQGEFGCSPSDALRALSLAASAKI